jgi:hypothetical protein
VDIQPQKLRRNILRGVDALIFKWISNDSVPMGGFIIGVNTLNFKINLFYYNASAVRVRNDSRALRI